MKIGIIGGGAIGLLCASMFSKKNVDVEIFTRTKEQANQINEQGVLLEENGEVETVPVLASVFSGEIKDVDCLFITVKQYHLSLVLNRLKVCSHIPVIFLQNGMSHEEIVEKESNYYLGIVEHGAKRLGKNKVSFTGNGRIVLGVKDRIESLDQLIHLCGESFLIEIHEDIVSVMKKKLVANACINPLTGLLGVKNGELVRNQHYYQMMKTLFDEVVVALDLKERDELWEYVCEICEKTKFNTSSMLSDIEKGSKTEIEAIMGYIKKQGQQRQEKVGIIRFVYDGIKGKEERDVR